MENWFVDNVAEPENLGRLLDRLVDLRAAIVSHYAAAAVDCPIPVASR